MCLRNILMVPKDDVLSFLVCWGLCRRLGTLETLMLWWKFSLDLGQYFTTYIYTMYRQWCDRERPLGKASGGLSSFCGGILLGKTPQVSIYIFWGIFPCEILPQKLERPHGVFPRGHSLSHHWRSIVYIFMHYTKGFTAFWDCMYLLKVKEDAGKWFVMNILWW